jgi:hypothetical protein
MTTPPSPLLCGWHAAHVLTPTRRQWQAEQTKGDRRLDWKTSLASLTGTVDQELLRRNAYLVTEHRLRRPQLTGRLRLHASERQARADIGQTRGKPALQAVATLLAAPGSTRRWQLG